MCTRSHRARPGRFRALVAMLVLLASVMGAATIVAEQIAPGETTTPRKTVPPARARKVAPKGPSLGVPATPAQIESADVSIGPDGAGLPPGSGTPAQGEAIFNTKCIACHGPQGSGTVNDQLVGGGGTLTSPTPIKTIGSYWPYATTVFDYVRRAMPYPTPHSLSDQEVYAITAYLLNLNGVIGKDAVMDAKTLPQVQMPNRGNFILFYPDRQR
jgi:S-disulfanyl-L-cysteine oxidoreductase SoxD